VLHTSHFLTHANFPLRIMSALSMTTAVSAKVAIAGKSVVSKRNVAAAPSKRGQLVRVICLLYFFYFLGEILPVGEAILSRSPGRVVSFSGKREMLAGFDAGQIRSVGEYVRTRSRKTTRRTRFARERVFFTFASRRKGVVRAHFSARYRLISPPKERVFSKKERAPFGENFSKLIAHVFSRSASTRKEKPLSARKRRPRGVHFRLFSLHSL